MLLFLVVKLRRKGILGRLYDDSPASQSPAPRRMWEIELVHEFRLRNSQRLRWRVLGTTSSQPGNGFRKRGFVSFYERCAIGSRMVSPLSRDCIRKWRGSRLRMNHGGHLEKMVVGEREVLRPMQEQENLNGAMG